MRQQQIDQQEKTLLRKDFYATIQQDMKNMIGFYQQQVLLLEEMQEKFNSVKGINRDTEIENIKSIIYRTEYFTYQLKSNIGKIDRPI